MYNAIKSLKEELDNGELKFTEDEPEFTEKEEIIEEESEDEPEFKIQEQKTLFDIHQK
jgi:hypothetical protein